MKPNPLITLIVLALALSNCAKSRNSKTPTVVEGYVKDSKGSPLMDVDVGLLKMTSAFSFNSYQLVLDVKTDKNGFYRIETDKDVEAVHAYKIGYFSTEDGPKLIHEGGRNQVNMGMEAGCKINLTLNNPNNYRLICVFTPIGSQCQFQGASECFLEQGQIRRSCYLAGGDTVRIGYRYEREDYSSVSGDTCIFFPKGGEQDVVINYDFEHTFGFCKY